MSVQYSLPFLSRIFWWLNAGGIYCFWGETINSSKEMRKVCPCFCLQYKICYKRIFLQSAWRKKVKRRHILKKLSTTFNREGSRKETFKQILQMEVHGTWWNSSTSAKGEGQYHCKAILLSWEGHGDQGSSLRTGRKEEGVIDELQASRLWSLRKWRSV